MLCSNDLQRHAGPMRSRDQNQAHSTAQICFSADIRRANSQYSWHIPLCLKTLGRLKIEFIRYTLTKTVITPLIIHLDTLLHDRVGRRGTVREEDLALAEVNTADGVEGSKDGTDDGDGDTGTNTTASSGAEARTRAGLGVALRGGSGTSAGGGGTGAGVGHV